MKPLGRKYFKGKLSKHHIRVKGKFQAWWLDVCGPNKTKEKQQARSDIKQELE